MHGNCHGGDKRGAMRLFALAVATTALAASAATKDWGVPCVLGYCKGQRIEGVQSWMKGTHERRTRCWLCGGTEDTTKE